MDRLETTLCLLKKDNEILLAMKKRGFGERTIRVESLDVYTAERINRGVSASAKQYAVESHSSLQVDEPVFRGPVKTLKLKIK